MAAAREATALLDADRTANRLAASLPLFDDGDLVATIGFPRAVDEALAERQDIAAVSMRVDGIDAFGDLRYRQTERNVPVVDTWDVDVADAAPGARGRHRPRPALVPGGTDALLRDLGGRVRDVWLVGGVGRVLPGRLFDAAVAATENIDEMLDPEEAAPDVLSLERIDRIAGPRAASRPRRTRPRVSTALSFPSCCAPSTDGRSLGAWLFRESRRRHPPRTSSTRSTVDGAVIVEDLLDADLLARFNAELDPLLADGAAGARTRKFVNDGDPVVLRRADP